MHHLVVYCHRCQLSGTLTMSECIKHYDPAEHTKMRNTVQFLLSIFKIYKREVHRLIKM